MWDWLPSDILYMETTVQLIHCPTASNDHTAGKYKDRHTQCDQTHNTITGNSKMMQNIWNDAEHDEQQLHRNITLPISAIYDHQNNYRRIDQNKSRRQHIVYRPSGKSRQKINQYDDSNTLQRLH